MIDLSVLQLLILKTYSLLSNDFIIVMLQSYHVLFASNTCRSEVVIKIQTTTLQKQIRFSTTNVTAVNDDTAVTLSC